MTSTPSNARNRQPQLRAFTPDSPGKAHLVGVCGAGMKALAELLFGLGWQLSGTDLEEPNSAIVALQRRGLKFHRGHQPQHVPADADLLIYSPAISPENSERLTASNRGLEQLSYTEMLGRLMQERTGVCIAGTHGKSTTTAMTAYILRDARLSPSAVFGAELCGSLQSGWAGGGDLFVVESCEYKRSFLKLAPKIAAILSVEPDHFDCFETVADMQNAFEEFVSLVPADGTLLVNGGCTPSVEAARACRAPVVTFSEKPGCDWWAADIRTTKDGMRFRAFHRGEFLTEISIPLVGAHNVMNALAAAAIAFRCGVSTAGIRESLREFPGIRRRMEPCGTWRGVSLYDDYAHHPTAVRASLDAARAKHGQRRIWCVFQPHQVSRTRALMEQFAGSFRSADEVLIAPVYAAREGISTEPSLASAELASKASAHGTHARFFPSLDRIMTTLEDEARPGDVLITMGAGDINRVHHEFARQLRRHRPAG